MLRAILCILVALASASVYADVQVTATPAIQSQRADLWVVENGVIRQRIKRGQWTFCPGGRCPGETPPPDEFETPEELPEFEAPPADSPALPDEVTVSTEQNDYALLAGAVGAAAFLAAGIRYRLSKRDPELVEDAVDKSEIDDVVEV